MIAVGIRQAGTPSSRNMLFICNLISGDFLLLCDDSITSRAFLVEIGPLLMLAICGADIVPLASSA